MVVLDVDVDVVIDVCVSSSLLSVVDGYVCPMVMLPGPAKPPIARVVYKRRLR